ncbi:hypothetical protein UCRPC4_g03635 [Phaeomoniella chlamydospora]|uniref:LysM domain-containing protein n=1 Tax=Phaeomoniella chlamydospora TaxID=158046 RepID=A0A0G2EH36_PHACM|nr:hypothetical protein UCRPC4_g03635 [Phaeomoniella chlamydospora]
MNADGSTLNPSFDTSSTVRPRKGRLISYNDEHDSDKPIDPARASPQPRLSSPFSSRGASPVPRTQLPRPESNAYVPNLQINGNPARTPSSAAHGPVSPSTNLVGNGIWESWSSLQGIASSLLGSDAAQPESGKPRGRSPLGMAYWRKASKSSTSTNTTEWGPKASTSSIAAGSQEERQALVQAKKREMLMRADVDQTLDAKGRHKRRDSDGRQWTRTQEQPDEDALVYIHHVKPEDTLAGVMIKYGCQPAVFRKVNRFWPNDNIQIRKVVLLPVEACSVRGKKVENDLMDLVDHDGEDSSSSSITPRPDIVVSTPKSIPRDAGNEDPIWKHEHFVKIDGIPEAVEIGRLPRRTLGFFPPSRRKSVTFSDLETSTTADSRNASLELNRQLSLSKTLPMNGSPSRSRPSRRRASSAASTASNPYFLSRLRGPGGVGSLTSRRAVAPGPAPDSLNKLFAAHLPNVDPPENLNFLIEDDDGISSHHSRASSTTATSSSLENVGGAIEGWLRKMGTKVANASNSGAVPPLGTSPAGAGAGLGGRSGFAGGSSAASRSRDLAVGGWIPSGKGGDLIELGETPLEFQGDNNEGILAGFGKSTSAPTTARTSTSGFMPSSGITTGAGGGGGGGGSSAKTSLEQERALRERFPHRGGSERSKSKGD